VKSTNEKRDILATHIANITGDICATILRVEVANHSDLIRRLKLDLEKYAALSLLNFLSCWSLIQ
jgi:hypothetical protein